MQIVLPGALPDPAEARELATHVQQAAPTLTRWMQHGQARIVACDTTQAACTPYEQWLLDHNGFTSQAGQNLSCGLGPLLACQNNDSGSTGPVWLAELVHISPSRDGAALLPARDLDIEPGQSLALFTAAQRLWAESGFTVTHTATEHWQVTPPTRDTLPESVSPSLVGLTSVNDWWPQDTPTRPWRRLVNELQMLWFEHPVNLARAHNDQPAINSLWVFGGAERNQFHTPEHQPQAQTFFDLAESHARHDWGGWITALDNLEKKVFQPLAQRKTTPTLILGRHDRFVELRPHILRKLVQWLPAGRESWRTWWSPHN